ncbi:acetoin utilization AcuB family protein [Priestia megaterium]|uniref:acetoin utilization AcuB family protein n=1 Tax=Priestia megaterium TaxID=1404 RepID=UPI0013E31D17|nr:acetoin utilization AcuB family protein [Priestia megaterium]MED3862077.1 acetoin utilization AcuB family protein [Priestia megaterium]MED4100393.1 acetoin utilization AcuB family protein [Priestia megaterium]MED4142735.1 acetoin utilization AcuB family protein [Priestia megaterium]MED4167714.1 acetoin utilization AcuB family protein [Priestia megaterium]MED4198010.1 acetoin utilization AcuB family protein [Priestia megaterium]
MIVEEMMKTDLVTLTPDHTIAEAMKLLDTHKIRHIPIVNDLHHVVGIISDRDVRDASPSILDNTYTSTLLSEPVRMIMQTEVITAHPLDFVEEIASIFYEYQIGCIPVTKNKRLVGVVTERDLLHTFIQLTGTNKPGSQIEIKVENKAGVLAEVTSLFGSTRTNILSVLVYPDVDERYKILVLRIQAINPLISINTLKENGYEVLWPKLPEMK